MRTIKHGLSIGNRETSLHYWLFFSIIVANSCFMFGRDSNSAQNVQSRYSNDTLVNNPSIFFCGLKSISCPDLRLDYLEKNDSAITFFFTHAIPGDSLISQSYTLRDILCINKSHADSSSLFTTNMPQIQDKHVYAGAPSSFFLRFEIVTHDTDSIELLQTKWEGLLNFPCINLQSLSLVDGVDLSIYLSQQMTGTIAFYTRQRVSPLEVFIDDQYAGTVQRRIKEKEMTPECGDVGETLVNRRISAGRHTYKLSNGKIIWEGEVFVLRESCVKILVEK